MNNITHIPEAKSAPSFAPQPDVMASNLYVPDTSVLTPETALPARVQWKKRADQKTLTSALASRALLGMDLYTAAPIRTGNRYPQQRNYHGYYWHSAARMQLWHESLLERSILMWLDHSEDIVAIATQPFTILFADGTEHVPDFIALHANNKQVVYDVKPLCRINDHAAEQFRKTKAICDEVGWGYEVHTELSEPLASNLAWVQMFRHPRFYPGLASVQQLTDALTEPVSLDAIAALLPDLTLGNARAAVYHLVWERILDADLTQPLSNTSLIRKASHAND